MKKDFYKMTEKILYDYNKIKAHIEFKTLELKEYESEDGLRAINYSYAPVKTNRISNPVEDIALLNSQRIHNILQDINRCESRLDSIMRGVLSLEEEEKAVIMLRYFKSMSWIQIATNIYRSERHVQRIKRKAINKLKVVYFGLDALEEIL